MEILFSLWLSVVSMESVEPKYDMWIHHEYDIEVIMDSKSEILGTEAFPD